ncbi:YhcN/YlaJ family sporulation lipoprotein [Paenibacillus sp. GCM10027627]|uniref:YhcN/YlaJ family sporulation lipoprotein n=1 Tax=unclassified Paenibacillus TaxID=185978 RepID=UPI00363AA676
MRANWAALTAMALIGFMLGGCGMEYQGDLGNKNIRSNAIKYNSSGNMITDKRVADDGLNEKNRVTGKSLNHTNAIGSHKNNRLEMSRQIGDQIMGIREMKSSSVMLADRNAYVAVSLDQYEPKAHSKEMSRTHIGLFGKDGAATGKKMSSLSTGENKLTPELEAKIAKVIREHRPQTEHIYISANPEFVGRMNAYMNDAELGYPVQNYIMEFNALAERVFPVVNKNTETLQNKKVRRSGLLQ